MFPFNEKTYERLKWTAQVAAPASVTFVATILAALQFVGLVPDTVPIVTVAILGAVNTFIGALVGVSTKEYGKLTAKEQEELK